MHRVVVSATYLSGDIRVDVMYQLEHIDCGEVAVAQQLLPDGGVLITSIPRVTYGRMR